MEGSTVGLWSLLTPEERKKMLECNKSRHRSDDVVVRRNSGAGLVTDGSKGLWSLLTPKERLLLKNGKGRRLSILKKSEQNEPPAHSPVFLLATSSNCPTTSIGLVPLIIVFNDPCFRACMAEMFLCRTLWDQIDAFIYPAICTKTAPILLRECIDRETEEKKDPELFLREETVNTRIISKICERSGKRFLSRVVGKLVKFLSSLKSDLIESLTENFVESTVLEDILPHVFTIILNQIHLLTVEFAFSYHELQKKFEAVYQSDGKVMVACLFFLRFICPALINPNKYTKGKLKVHSIRSMLLLAKLVQRVANLYFSPKAATQSNFVNYFSYLDSFHLALMDLSTSEGANLGMSKKKLGQKIDQLRELINQKSEVVTAYYHSTTSTEMATSEIWALSKVLLVDLQHKVARCDSSTWTASDVEDWDELKRTFVYTPHHW